MRLAPTATFIGRERSWSPDLALFAFAGFALLAAWATRSSQVALERQAALLSAAEFTATARQQAAVALENSGQGWWDWDLRSGTALLDDTWHRLMGWEPGEITEPIAAWTTASIRTTHQRFTRPWRATWRPTMRDMTLTTAPGGKMEPGCG